MTVPEDTSDYLSIVWVIVNPEFDRVWVFRDDCDATKLMADYERTNDAKCKMFKARIGGIFAADPVLEPAN